MSIMKFNKDYFKRGIGFAYYCFVRSWPLSMSSVPVNYDSGSVLKLNVTFRYERYVMENVTRGMIRSGWKGYSDSFDPWLGTFPQVYQNSLPTKDDIPTDKTSVNSSVTTNNYDNNPTNPNRITREDGTPVPFWPWNWTDEDSDLLFGPYD